MRNIGKPRQHTTNFPIKAKGQNRPRYCKMKCWPMTALGRVNALRETGKSQVNAVLEPMTRKDALWAASVANAKHGVQLSRAEHVNVFKNYIAAGKHIKRKSPHGAVYKSYRDIADELPVGRTYGTIFNWMKRHFPSIAKAMSGSDLPPADGGLRDAWGAARIIETPG